MVNDQQSCCIRASKSKGSNVRGGCARMLSVAHLGPSVAGVAANEAGKAAPSEPASAGIGWASTATGNSFPPHKPHAGPLVSFLPCPLSIFSPQRQCKATPSLAGSCLEVMCM